VAPRGKVPCNSQVLQVLVDPSRVACLLLTLALVLGATFLLDQEGVKDWLRGAGHQVHGHLSRVGEHIRGAASAVHGHFNELKEHWPGVWELLKNASHAAHNSIKEQGPGGLEHVKNDSSAVHGE